MSSTERLFIVHELTREDLIDCRPDAIDQIDTLTDTQMQQIAERVGRLLQDEYLIALETVLMRYLPPQPDEIQDEEDGAEVDPLQ